MHKLLKKKNSSRWTQRWQFPVVSVNCKAKLRGISNRGKKHLSAIPIRFQLFFLSPFNFFTYKIRSIKIIMLFFFFLNKAMWPDIMEKCSKNMERYLKVSILPTFSCISVLEYIGSPTIVPINLRAQTFHSEWWGYVHQVRSPAGLDIDRSVWSLECVKCSAYFSKRKEMGRWEWKATACV